jgi:hypothetical protein
MASVAHVKVHWLRNAEDARALAHALLDPERDRPVVVVSTAAGAGHPYVQTERVADDLDGVAAVHVIPTGEVSWAFSEAMPPMTQVYGGASRVYPPGLEWREKPSRSPLRFAFHEDSHGVVADALVADAQGMAVEGGLTLSSVAADQVPVRGTVQGIVASRVFVRLENGDLATIWPEFVSAGVEAERLACRGMHVEGYLDPQTKRLDVASAVRSSADALGAYDGDAQVLARVTRVEKDTVALELYPGVLANLSPAAAVGSVDEDLRLFFSVGDVIVARVLEAGLTEGRRWRLSCARVDPDALLLEAPSLLPGGPPWLVPTPAIPEEDADGAAADETGGFVMPSPAELPAVGPTSDPAHDAMRAERDALTRVVSQLEAQRDRSVRRHEQSKQRLRRESQRAARLAAERDDLRQRLTTAAHDGDLFDTREGQFGFEVELAWARRIPKAEKASRPMVSYTIGPGFFPSWDCVDGVERSKVVDVVVEVLTGIADEQPGRQVHQLRQGPGGNDPFVTRQGGETCWRASLQVNTPSARRLHYWRRSNGSIELSAVRLHDDFRP